MRKPNLPTRDMMKGQDEFDFLWDFPRELPTRTEPEEGDMEWDDDGNPLF